MEYKLSNQLRRVKKWSLFQTGRRPISFLIHFTLLLFSTFSVAQCDSIPNLLPNAWTYDFQFITTDFVHIENCRVLTEHTQEFKSDCSPCTLTTKIENDDDPFFMYVDNTRKSEAYLNGIKLKPYEKIADRTYFRIEPAEETLNILQLKIWLRSDIHFNITGIKRDFDFETFLVKDESDFHKHHAVTNMFLGLLLASFMISFSSYIFSNSTDFKWYSVYVLVMFLFFLPRAILSNEILGLENKDIQMITQPLVYVFYNLFIISFLKITKKHALINFLLKAAMFMLVGFSLLFMISIFWGLDDFKSSLWTIFRLVALSYASITILFLFGVKLPLKYFIIMGSLALIIGAALSMLFTIKDINPIGISPIHWMYLGTVVELIVFYAGIGYRINLEHLEKLALSESLFEEMEKNKLLQEIKNKQLEEEVNIAEVKVKEEQKQKSEAQFELLLQKTEMQLLRAQMNPHFIFNSLNSIKSFIAKNEPRKATNFLNKFSKLIRIILNNSNSSTTSLKQEIQTLTFYLEVEQMRLDDDFSFTIDMEESLNEVAVQPLLIQPYVENAIWHGLVPKKGPKKIFIKVESIHQEMLKISIRDNGIGRVASQEFKTQNPSKKTSYGMQITNNRITKGKTQDNKVEIIDHYNMEGESQGTEVILLIHYKENLFFDENQSKINSPSNP